MIFISFWKEVNKVKLNNTKLARKNDIWKSKAKILIDRCF